MIVRSTPIIRVPATYPDKLQPSAKLPGKRLHGSAAAGFYSDMLIESLDTSECDAAIIRCWQELAESASDPNPFYEHWNLIEAINQLATDKVYLTLLWQDKSRTRLDAVFPLSIETGFRGLPIKRTGLWRHPYCYLCTPLIRTGTASTVLPAIRKWITAHTELPSFTTLYWLNGDGQVVRDLEAGVSGHSPTGPRQDLQRASLELTGSHNDYLATLRTKKRKEWARNWRRLGETGNLQTRIFDADNNPQEFSAAIERFLALENSGWKGEQNSSLMAKNTDASWFGNMMVAAQTQSQGLLLEISLDERPVGMISVILSACGSTAYTLKIATDTEFKQYSPGSQTILRLTEHAYEKMPVIIIDSCAAENHPMINRLWPARRKVTNLPFSHGNHAVTFLVPATSLARSFGRALKKTLVKGA